jgi:glycosyltransferase involved in cell wall biosynthesis
MRDEGFRGLCLFLVAHPADLDLARALRARLPRAIALAALPMGGAGPLTSLGAPFDHVLTPEPDEAPEVLLARVQGVAGPLLLALLSDDRSPLAAGFVAALKGLRLPTILMQLEPALPGDAFGIWPAIRPGLARWGATRPPRLALQSPALALSAGLAAARLPPDPFGVGGVGDMAFGRLPSTIRPLPDLPGEEILLEGGLLPAEEEALLAERAAARSAVLRFLGPGETAHEVRSVSLVVTRSAALAVDAVRLGLRAVLLDPAIPPMPPGAPLRVAAPEEVLRAVEEAWATDPDPAWQPPAMLLAQRSPVMMADMLASEIMELHGRAAARAGTALPPGLAPPPGLRRFDTASQLRFPAFPFGAMRGGLPGLPLPPIPRLVVIGHDWSDRTGLARPAKYALTAFSLLGMETLALEANGEARAPDILAELRRDDFVIFNSVGLFERSDEAAEVFARIDPSRRCLYLHETAYTLDRFAQEQPARFRRFLPLLAGADVLCVSGKQADFLAQRYGVRRTHVVYNTTWLPPRPDTAAPVRPVIAMAGTLQRRKGVDLFSRVADLAAREGLALDFQWIGHETEETPSLYLSPRVEWAGRMEGAALAAAMGRIDTLLLSSVDDPMPLSAIEAVMLGKRIVCYAATGTEELVRGLPGCAVFEEHAPEPALRALLAARAEPVSPACFAALEEDKVGLAAFLARLSRAITSIQARRSAVPSPVLAQ